MKIFSWNVNGIRSVSKKGFLSWLKTVNADLVCLQEIKAAEDQIPAPLSSPLGYQRVFNSAARPGYSGAMVYSRFAPTGVTTRIGFPKFDQEGRFVELEFPEFTLINVYLPHGGRQKENLTYKLTCYRHLIHHLKLLKNQSVILCGDFNIAHQEVDLARPKQNKNNIMFTPEERKQLDTIVSLGFTDSFRYFHLRGGHYTWWPYWGNARSRNLGWRLDYIFVSKSLSTQLQDGFISSSVPGSDHCPVGITL